MATRIQTADMYLANDTEPFQILMERPVVPTEIWDQVMNEKRVIGIRRPDSRIVLIPNGTIVLYKSDGSWLEFPSCPTIHEAVETRGAGRYFQFSRDGSVIMGENNTNYYFSKPFDAVPISVGPSDMFYGRLSAEGDWQVRKRHITF